MVNFIKVGAREDASAVLEEIRSWWPGDRHDFWVGDVEVAVQRRGGRPHERGRRRGRGIAGTKARRVNTRTFILGAEPILELGKEGRLEGHPERPFLGVAGVDKVRTMN